MTTYMQKWMKDCFWARVKRFAAKQQEALEKKHFINDVHVWTKDFTLKDENVLLSKSAFSEYIQRIKAVEQLIDFRAKTGADSETKRDLLRELTENSIYYIRNIKQIKIDYKAQKNIHAYFAELNTKVDEYIQKKLSYECRYVLTKVKEVQRDGTKQILEFFESRSVPVELLPSVDLPFSQEGLFLDCTSIKEVLNSAIKKITEITKTDYNQILLTCLDDSYATQLCVFADNVAQTKQRYRIAILDGLIGESYLTGKTIYARNVVNRENYFVAVSQTKSELVIPIRHNSNVIGVINLESETINYFSQEIINSVFQLSISLGQALVMHGFFEKQLSKEIPYVHMS